MAQPIYRSSIANASTGTSVTVAAPAFRVGGDLLLGFTSKGITAPSGWTPIRSSVYQSPFVCQSYWRFADGTSNDNFPAVGTTAGISAAIAAFQMPTTTATPILASAEGASAGVLSVSATLAVTQDVLLVEFECSNASGSVTSTSATANERLDDATNRHISVYDRIVSAGSYTETITETGSATGRAMGMQLIAIRSNTPPNSPTALAPAGATTVDRSVTQRFSWTTSDPDVGDTQSQSDLQYRLVGAGAWTSVTQTSPNAFYDFAPNTFPAGDYEWQVRTYDAQGAVGPWSPSAFFTAGNAPGAPTITAPTNGSTIPLNSTTVTWSTPTQDAYQVRTVADNAGSPNTSTVYTDSGTIVDSAARSRTVSFAVNNRYEHVQVRERVGGLWSAWASTRVQISFTPPATPTLTAAASTALAAIVVTVTNPTAAGGQPTVASTDLYRRPVGDTTAGIRVATNVATAWTDYTPASGVNYEYQAVAVGTNGTTAASAWTA